MSNLKIDCECCPSPANARYQWGLFEEPDGNPRRTDMYVEDLCEACSDDLWDRIRGCVNAGHMYFAVKKMYFDPGA